jgi:hypothetical protein
MAKTGAERQAAYRARQAVEDSGQRRISTWISTEAANALEKLAERYGVTMRGAIELLLLREHEAHHKGRAGRKFSARTASNKKRSLPSNDVARIDTVPAAPPAKLSAGNGTFSVSLAAADEVRKIPLPHNDLFPLAHATAAAEEALPSNKGSATIAAESSRQARSTRRPMREEQYSLEF